MSRKGDALPITATFQAVIANHGPISNKSYITLGTPSIQAKEEKTNSNSCTRYNGKVTLPNWLSGNARYR